MATPAATDASTGNGDRGAGTGEGGTAFGVWGAVLLIAAVGFYVAYQYVGPPPPRSITLATGSPQGAYHAFGTLYRETLATHGIELVLRPSAGSLENIALLRAGDADVAFVQGGTIPGSPVPPGSAELVGIAGLYHEPLWIFHRAELEFEQLNELAGRSIQVGGSGSGTRAVAIQILALNDVSADTATLHELPTDDAIERLLGGELDALFLVAGLDAAPVRRLLQHEGDELRLFEFGRELAYERILRSLDHVVLAEGQVDLGANVPDRPVDLLAPLATLVAGAELHPALVPLLIEAAEHAHASGGSFEDEGQYPSALGVDVPLATAARHYYSSGRSFLYRVLPFQLAAVLDRLKILLLPLITLLLPLFKLAPPLYRWRIRSRIYRWYREIHQIEQRMFSSSADSDLRAHANDLDAVSREIHGVKVPPSYMEELYNLRWHLARIREATGAEPAATGLREEPSG